MRLHPRQNEDRSPLPKRFFDVVTLLSFPQTASHHGLPITQDLPSLSYRLLRLLIPDPQSLSRNKYRGGLTQPLHITLTILKL